MRPTTIDLIALDAFTSDAIPVHLLTREAIAGYLPPSCRRDGVLIVHISNRHMDLAPVVAAVARSRPETWCVFSARTTPTSASPQRGYRRRDRPCAAVLARWQSPMLGDLPPADPAVRAVDRDYAK